MMSSVQWIASILKDHDRVVARTVLSNYCIEVRRRSYPPVIVGVIKEDHVTIDHIARIVANNQAVDIIVNIPTNHTVSKDLYDYCERNNISFGGVSELRRAIGRDPIPVIPNAEAEFVMRSLRQHSVVKNVVRVDTCRYLINRDGLSTVEIVTTNAYDVTSDALRSAVNRFGKSDAIICTNPNHRISSSAHGAIAGSGWKVMTWGELYGALNRSKL